MAAGNAIGGEKATVGARRLRHVDSRHVRFALLQFSESSMYGRAKKADVPQRSTKGHAEAFNSGAGRQFPLCNTGRSKSRV